MLEDPTILKTDGGIDMNLGMSWLTKHKSLISCSPRTVNFEHPSSMRVQNGDELRMDALKKVEPHASTVRPLQDVPDVYDYTDFFKVLIRTLSSLLFLRIERCALMVHEHGSKKTSLIIPIDGLAELLRFSSTTS